jgi:hypothetical protein
VRDVILQFILSPQHTCTIHIVYNDSKTYTICYSAIRRGGGCRIMPQLFILSYSDAVSFCVIRGHLGTIPSIVTFYICACHRSKRGNKWEMLSYEAWTDERTAVCHNKPVFWRAYKNERPISWNYKIWLQTVIFNENVDVSFSYYKDA